MKIKLVLFFLFILSGSSHVKALGATLPDSAKYKWIKGEKFMLHAVKPQETWNSISRKYDLRISELMNANLGVIDLKVGQILNIPAKSNTAANTKKTESALPLKSGESGNTAIMYSVRAGETLFGISKKFGSSVDDVKKWNNLSDNIVHEGQQLIVSYVPGSVEAKQEKKSEPNAVSTTQPEKKETEKNVSESKPKENKPEKITEVKKTPDEEVKTKDVLVTKKEEVSKEPVKIEKNAEVKKVPVEEPKTKDAQDVKKDDVLKEISKPEKNPQVAPPDVVEANAEISSKNPDLNDNPTRSMIPVGKGSSGKTIMQVSESGVCSWITDADVNQNKFYGLHRTAPIGTIVKVTNRMNDRYVFVKIVGVLPDTGENEKSIIKISQAAVNKVGALDAHFQVELSYGVLQ